MQKIRQNNEISSRTGDRVLRSNANKQARRLSLCLGVRCIKISPRRRSGRAIKGHVEFDTITRAVSRPVSASFSMCSSLSPEIDAGARSSPYERLNPFLLFPLFLLLALFACPLAAELAEWRSRLVLTCESTRLAPNRSALLYPRRSLLVSWEKVETRHGSLYSGQESLSTLAPSKYVSGASYV